jgi:L-threonylcarbamoyladenylate synthase
VECGRTIAAITDTGDAIGVTAEPTTQLIKANRAGIARAARVLAAGGLVAFPTETVYGLGADASNGAAVARLYQAKGRPAFNPLIAHVPDLSAARSLARFNAAAERLAAAFWPGPLTLVLPKPANCPVAELATAGLDTVAVRVPNHPLARDILLALRRPVVAPSANRSGHLSPTTAQHVLADLRGRIELIVDGGPAPVGLESTIVACLDRPSLLRPGALPRGEIERVVALAEPTATAAATTDAESPLAPGQLVSHYAPRARLRLDARRVEPGEGLLAFGPAPAEGSEHAALALNLSVRGDLIEAAANLFSHLRALDGSGAATIAVMPVPRCGLGEAINDRLERAAAPRRRM